MFGQSVKGIDFTLAVLHECLRNPIQVLPDNHRVSADAAADLEERHAG